MNRVTIIQNSFAALAASLVLASTGPAIAQESIEVTFKNNLAEPVTLFWVDGETKEEVKLDYPPIPKGGSQKEETFVGHRFLGKTKGDQMVGDFIAKEANQVFTFGKEANQGGLSTGLLGKYEQVPVENDWHKVSVEPGANGNLIWKNAAGVSWTLEIRGGGELWAGKDCPYGEAKLEVKKDNAGKVTGIQFNDGYYKLLAAAAPEKAPAIRDGNVGTGFVFGVNKPGDANFKALAPDFGDRVETTLYTPTNDRNKDLGLVSGGEYTMLMITGKDDQQAFIYWETPDPAFQDILLRKSTKIASMANKGFTLQRGDKLTIQAQKNSEGPGTDVTFSYSHDGKPTGTTSFIVN